MTRSFSATLAALSLCLSLSALAARPGARPVEDRRQLTEQAVVNAPETSLDKASLMRPDAIRDPGDLGAVWKSVEAVQSQSSGALEALRPRVADFLRFSRSSLTPYEAFTLSNAFAGRQASPTVSDVEISRQDPRALRLGDRIDFGSGHAASSGIVVAVSSDSFGGVLVLSANRAGQIQRSMVSMRDVTQRVAGSVQDGHPL